MSSACCFLPYLRVELHVVAELLAELGLEVLAVLDAVDDPLLDGLLRRVHGAVDPLAYPLGLHAAALRHHLLVALVEAVEEPVPHPGGLGAGALPHEDLGRALVLPAGEKVRLHADRVQQAPHVGRLGVEARDDDDRGGRHADPRGPGHQRQRPRRQDRVDVGVDRLARRLDRRPGPREAPRICARATSTSSSKSTTALTFLSSLAFFIRSTRSLSAGRLGRREERKLFVLRLFQRSARRTRRRR